MSEYFFELSNYVTSKLASSEVGLLNYSGEVSDFVRFNQSKVRQATNVVQREFSLELISGQRHVSAATTLAGDAGVDRARLDELLKGLRDLLPSVPEDPYLLYSTEIRSGRHEGPNRLPSREQALDAILRAGASRDLVGIYAAGEIQAGFANSLGQRNWFSTHSFHFDWSFYHAADKAVKSSYAGFEWDQRTFDAKVAAASDQLAILTQPARTIAPGPYRVYLAPAALDEFVGMLNWGGFGLKAHRTKFTPLLKMITEGARLSPQVTLRENTAEGIAPNFQSSGYVKPAAVTMIEAGQFKDCLVSPRSAKEYGVPCNGASGGEFSESMDVAEGTLNDKDVLSQLGTGIYVNTLWYLNYSDRPAGRITGMTRFATFWVEGGKIVAPLNVMRFDETVFRVLGENLLGLTKQRDFIPSSSTYGGRSTASIRLPGALVKDFAFTL